MKDAVSLLFPPDIPRSQRWRLAVFMTCVLMILFVTWALSPYGFALASELRALQTNVDDMRIGQIEQQLYDARQSECVSKMYSSERRFFANRVMELARKYENLSNHRADTPPCAQGISP